MARLQSCCWILAAAIAVSIGAPHAVALEVELPAEDASRHDVFTIHGLTIPQPAVDVGDVGGQKLTVNIADGSDSRFTAHNRGMYWFVHQYAVEQGYAMEYGWGSAADTEILVEVQHAIAASSVVAVFDSLAQELAVAGEPTKTYDSPPQPFDIVLFEEGSAALRMEGLESGTTVHYLYGSPGHRPVVMVAVDGGLGDNDGIVDGRITVAPPRNRRVPFVLAGDTILAVADGDVRGIAAASAGGRQVRYTVPVVSRVRGATGSLFVSDLEMANAYGLPVRGFMYFVPSNGGVAEALEQSFTLAPGQTVSIDDVLASVFDHEGGGSGALHLGDSPCGA